jgi:ubiquinone/menaquinone biosynthesis C-methylase UbiE
MEAQHTCPVWVGRLMISPLRKLMQHPEKILSNYIQPGMNILEIGPAMGFFSLPMAKMLDNKGQVYCVDIQVEMLDKLKKRAEHASLGERISTIVSTPDNLMVNNLYEKIDFCLLFAVVHEVPGKIMLFDEVYKTLKPGGEVLFSEPKGHVSPAEWMQSLSIAESSGLKKIRNIKISGSHGILLKKEI